MEFLLKPENISCSHPHLSALGINSGVAAWVTQRTLSCEVNYLKVVIGNCDGLMILLKSYFIYAVADAARLLSLTLGEVWSRECDEHLLLAMKAQKVEDVCDFAREKEMCS